MKHRVFIAINLPAVITSEVEKLQLKLDKSRYPVVWEKPSKAHLTLNFMGRLLDEEISKVRQVAKSILVGYRPFELRLGLLGTLYIRHEPSVVYLTAMEKEGILMEMQKSLASQLDAITPQPGRKFLPHVTIGRVQKADPTFVKQTLDQLTEEDIDPLTPFLVEKVDIMESFLSKAGSSYQHLGSLQLGE